MRRPEFITFTGIDERTNLRRVCALSDRYDIEWAVLLSEKRQGKDPRYPSSEVLENFTDLASTMAAKAAHLCGAYADDVVEGRKPRLCLDRVGRFQINHREATPVAIELYGRLCGAVGIMQVRGDRFPSDAPGVQMLFDRSGGTGQRPDTWPIHPGGDRMVGYAGGIGPDNVLETIAAINSTGPYWLDMESGVRTNNWLDLDKCEAVLRAVYG